MTAATAHAAPPGGQDTPIDDFSTCHEGILAGLDAFASAPVLFDAAKRARRVAELTLRVMDDAVLQHHAEEEEELFKAVLRSAQSGAEREHVQGLVWRLTDEHRAIEGLWKRLRPEVVRAAAGKPAELKAEAVNLLVDVYRQHAGDEERNFLPLARDILGRDGNHMAALGISLHMRHAAVPVGYI